MQFDQYPHQHPKVGETSQQSFEKSSNGFCKVIFEFWVFYFIPTAPLTLKPAIICNKKTTEIFNVF